CTICRRTYTGAPYRTSARSTISMARSTPAQNDRGAASSTLSSRMGSPIARPSPRAGRNEAGRLLPPDVPPEGRHREHHPVQVVVDVEVPGEPGAGEPRLVPRPVGQLGVHQEGDALLDGPLLDAWGGAVGG